MQQGVQTDATCNTQQCWELFANNVASVCTGLILSILNLWNMYIFALARLTLLDILEEYGGPINLELSYTKAS